MALRRQTYRHDTAARLESEAADRRPASRALLLAEGGDAFFEAGVDAETGALGIANR